MQYGSRPIATEIDRHWHLPILACCLTELRPLSDHPVTDLDMF